jgi:CHAT domain-containing protein
MMREVRLDIRAGVDPGLLARERSIQELLDAKHERLTRLLAAPHNVAREAEERRQLDQLVDAYQAVEAELRIKSPAYAALMAPRAVSLDDVQSKLLDSTTALVEFWLGDDRSYAWVVTRSDCRGFELPPRARIAPLATRAYRALNARNENPAESPEQRSARISAADAMFSTSAAELSRRILRPLRGALKAQRLWIVSDGELEYLPLAAFPLPGSTQPLVSRYEIAGLPSASVLSVVRHELADRPAAARTVSVFADPVFHADDPRVARNGAAGGSDRPRPAAESGVATLPRLYFSRDEADAIVALAPGASARKAVDFDASRSEAKNGDLGRYRVVHFATHGLLDSRHPELSGIVLSMVDRRGQPQDGFLRLHEIYNLKLNAELVVLSACQTALGQEVRSEGLVGLVRGFMYAGSPQVLASLWSVRDRATAEFMGRFYEGLFKQRLTPQAALRAVQLSMLTDQRWNQPYYWAAFTLQGAAAGRR